MTRNTLFIFLIALCLGSCSKSNSGSASFNYAVNNIQDVTISQYGTIDLPLQVQLLSGNSESVNITISGLPAGVADTPNAKSGTPSFTTDFLLSATNTTTGTYPVTVTAISSSGLNKTYNFNLTVIASPSATFIGKWQGAFSCDTGVSSSITFAAGATPSNVTWSVQLSTGSCAKLVSIIGSVSGNTLTFPNQSFTDNCGQLYTISGAGTLSSSNVLTFTETVGPGTPFSCTFTGTKL